MNVSEGLVEAWQVQHRVNLKLLDLVGEEKLKSTYSKRIRDVAKVFSHIHNLRILWMEGLDMMPEGVRKIDKSAVPKVDAIREALNASSKGVEAMIIKLVEKGEVPSFKRSPTTFVSYLIAHEAHHRGQIIAAMRVSGHPLSESEIHGLWDWDQL
jgi:uncharacterized damage-inducible protein DinB